MPANLKTQLTLGSNINYDEQFDCDKMPKQPFAPGVTLYAAHLL